VTELRPELKAFAEAMEDKLRERDPDRGDSWKECDELFLTGALSDEMREIAEASNAEERAAEAVDVSNFLFFLWWRATQMTLEGRRYRE
jgi:hypothetical protein